MKQIVISGGHIVTPEQERLCDLLIDGALISCIGTAASKAPGAQRIDASGCWVTPGLIDLQVNGGPACDFWADPGIAEVSALAMDLARAGVTTILPTLITDDLDHLRKNINFLETQVGVGEGQLSPGQAAAESKSASKSSGTAQLKQRPLPVRMPGIHLEGPCLSPQRPGVHPPQHLQPLTLAVLERIAARSVKLITLAPELDPSGQCISFLEERGIKVALGHSNATFEEAQKAFDEGVSLMTHTFNALPPIHHRAPGAVVAALLDDRVSCCLICDGAHLAPAAAKLIFKAKGVGRSILVTDIAHVGTSRGGLVGSSIMLDTAVRNVVSWGAATFQQAVTMASYNPACAMGWQNSVGHIAAGKAADLVVWDKQTLAIKHVIAGGELLF